MSNARMNTHQVIGFQLIEHDFGNVTYRYMALLAKYPVAVKALTSAILNLIGDLICQVLQLFSALFPFNFFVKCYALC